MSCEEQPANDCIRVNKARAAILFILATLILAGLSHFVDAQATLDAGYYHIMATRLETGNGFVEPVVWQNLNKYETIERPMDYWLPLGIVIYYFARIFSPEAGEIWCNILIWAILALAVYLETARLTRNHFYATCGYLLHLFHGRNLFYLLTTDNFAFSALLGYFFIRSVALNDVKQAGFNAGLFILLRIEGAAYAVFNWLQLLISGKHRQSLIFAGISALVVTPWIIRNLVVFGRPWPSNLNALLMTDYYSFFDDAAVFSLQNYLAIGWLQILQHKLAGLMHGFTNLLLVPTHLLLLPLFAVGLATFWEAAGKHFARILALAWLMCGLAFPLQAEHGTAMHISAFFYPHFAILIACGFAEFEKRRWLRKTAVHLLVIFGIIWGIAVSAAFISYFRPLYADDSRPYLELFAENPLDTTDRVVSANPILVNRLTRATGVLASKHTTTGPQAMADRFGCNLIILDARNRHPQAPAVDASSWQLIASTSILQLYRRK